MADRGDIGAGLDVFSRFYSNAWTTGASNIFLTHAASRPSPIELHDIVIPMNFAKISRTVLS
jgi:hypothetical protein